MAITHDENVRRLKTFAKYANYVLSIVVVSVLVAAILYWIYEEVALRDFYAVNIFLDGDPKFREARMILFIGYIITLIFISMIQCCIGISKDPLQQHIGPRRVVWCLSSTLTILIFICAIALAATFQKDTLVLLEDNMSDNITNDAYYANFSAGQFSSTGKNFNLLQSKFECCGVNGRSDYSTFNQEYDLLVPHSCCPLKDGMSPSDDISGDDVISGCQTGNGSSIHGNGCYDALVAGTSRMCREIIIFGSIAVAVIFVVTFLRISLGYYYQKHKREKQYEAVQGIAMKKKDNDQVTSM